jgi:class 3 adenylate cyclase
MAWDYNTASNRIDSMMDNVPAITVETFANRLHYLTEARVMAGLDALGSSSALIDIPRDRAIAVDAVHIYANLINYNEYRLEDGQETEFSHKQALAFLHLHYGATDRLIDDLGAKRVDFHSGRMHCVVVDPVDDPNARAIKAMEIAHRLQEFLDETNTKIADGKYQAKLRIGIDMGPSIAINSGVGDEQEPLFLGNSANHAAHLAEKDDKEGIFYSETVAINLNMGNAPTDEYEPFRPLSESAYSSIVANYQNAPGNFYSTLDTRDIQFDRLIKKWNVEISEQASNTGGVAAFNFHVHQPPIVTIEFGDLSPGNSIRMSVGSIFADVTGYTRYIESCRSNNKAADAVRALHVIRGELSNVLSEDFGGRKVRYIGDCIHGLVSEGTVQHIDGEKTSVRALECAAAMQSSFQIIKDKLPGIEQLGLAIGIDFGPTPISRIGIRGERSVRVASSRATIASQAAQDRCDSFELEIAENAFDLLPANFKYHFDEQRKIAGLDYAVFGNLFAPPLAAPAIKAHNSQDKTGTIRAHAK